MKKDSFIYNDSTKQNGKATWESPSNIALIKYWGKRKGQLPENPSLSFTLSNCISRTSVQFSPKETSSQEVEFDFKFNGEKNLAFEPKLRTFFERILPYAPYLKNHSFSIDSNNTFPHSSGIASSASSMSALALGVLSLEKLASPKMEESYFNKKASFLARLGSGSAARSIEGPVSIWGETTEFKNSSDLYAIPFSEELAPVFKTYQDTILIIDKGQKKVSSSIGHDLMLNHPYSSTRFEQARKNIGKLKSILITGELDDFIQLVESEALALHALMMVSSPYFILMQPNTLNVINKIWDFRLTTQLPLCFTLDAGANVHLLYPSEIKEKVNQFITEELSAFCQNGQYINDYVGFGAKKI